MNIHVSTFINGNWRQNAYLVKFKNEGISILIDPGYEDTRIVEQLREFKPAKVIILLTHAHIDHVGFVSELSMMFSAETFLCKHDMMLLKQANLYARIMGDHSPIVVPIIDNVFCENNIPKVLLELGIEVIFTPGHTPGSVSYLLEGLLFSGDFIFRQKPGRYDLPGGNIESIQNSLKKISEIDPKTVVLPGHGDPFRLNEITYGAAV